MRSDADVIVVGAGLAGLAAAHRLQERGVSSLVLEGSDRVGGRVRTELLDGSPAELGAEWTGPRHTHLRGLVRELGLDLEPARLLGRPVLWRDGTGRRVSRFPERGDAVSIARLLWKLGRVARSVDPAAPWRSPGAGALDRISVAGWFARNGTTPGAARVLGALVGMLASAPVDRVSLLQVLWWVARGGGPLSVLHTTFAWHIKQGSHAVPRLLSDRLGDAVRLDQPVRSIRGTGPVAVETGSGRTFTCRQVVVTGTLGSPCGITFDPPLPEPLGRLSELSVGPGTKVAALLPPEHPTRHRMVLGGGPLGAAWRSGDRVTGFAGPERGGASDAELLADLADAFRARPDELRHERVVRWSDHPYVPGCDLSFAPGQITRLGPSLAASHGPVHFAGAERSSWPNNMEGAVESGERAAVRVLQQLAS
jgi:monoamine oxidase